MAKTSVLIKKYSDRRLYDTSTSRYVTLDDIARMVRGGKDVQVVQARGGKDVTPTVLTQIIVEGARGQGTALPLQLLKQLVRSSDRATHDFLSWYLNNTLELFQKVQDTARTRLPDAKAAVSHPLDFVRNLLAGQGLPATSSPPPSDDARKLENRIQELEARLAQRDKPARRAPKARRRARQSGIKKGKIEKV